MRLLSTCILIIAGGWPWAADAQLQLLPDKEPQCVFAGQSRTVNLTWHNEGDATEIVRVRTRILQASSATTTVWDEKSWKELVVLEGQTVLESAQLDFPAVRAKTKFLIQWLKNTNQVLGTTEVIVYPTNLLAALRELAGDRPLGVLDPQNQLKPLLKAAGVDFTDLENGDVGQFLGGLAILGPFESTAQIRKGLADQVLALAKRGAAVVWFQPPPGEFDRLMPSFYQIAFGTNAVMVVDAKLGKDLPEQPEAQLHLIYFCQLAMNSRSEVLPGLLPVRYKYLKP